MDTIKMERSTAMTAEYDPETGATKYPNETEEAREAREKRERVGVGQPAEGGEDAGKHAERQSEKDRKAAEHKSGQHSSGE
jgi:hypothetical protein